MLQMDEHVFNCHETCKQQNDMLQKICRLQKSMSFINCDIVGIKHAFYLFYTCGCLEINFYFQSLCYIFDLACNVLGST